MRHRPFTWGSIGLLLALSLAAPLFAAEPKGNLVPLDLARGKAASASSNQGEEHLPGMAVDGDGETRWCASGGELPQWLQVDFGKAEDLTGCRIAWEKANGAYHYVVEGSADGKRWTTLSDQSKATGGPATRDLKFAPSAAAGIRYVKLTVNEAPEGAWASVWDFEVFGKQMTQASEQKKPVAKGGKGEVDPKSILARIKAPAGFEATMFAAPPDVSYVTCVAAAPSGPVFIGIDEDGSLGRKPGKGRVIRAIDSKNTGTADQFVTFATMDHPRGLIWDEGKLFVLHPPFLSVYYDGHGVADRSEVLVSGISNPKMVETRGADHTTNGIRMGIDGWIYIAVGDFGCPDAVGKDGTHLTYHYGGVLRVRPDGSGLEVYSRGERNIYDVAIDPLMNVFTRDNTNDGDNWNDRLAHIVPTGYYGYPSRFMHFPGEFIDALADFGGGSPCGSLFIDEPGLKGGLYTVEWGNSVIDYHPLTPNGAGYKVAPREKFIDLPRGTDLDVDGQSRLFASSWANGGFDYNGPNVGFVMRLAPTNFKAPAFPELKKETDEQLLAHFAAPSAVCRQATQREVLRRGDKPAFDAGLRTFVLSDSPIQNRVAALFTLELLAGKKAEGALTELAQKADLREFALRALADKAGDKSVPAKPFVDALNDANPRVRLVAAWGLGRLGHSETAEQIVPLVGDGDFLVSHVAQNALVALNAIDATLKAVEPSTSPAVTNGALIALQQMHDAKTVNGLLAAVQKAQDPAARGAIYRALCRLCYTEAVWDNGWWGTRPDTSGPYYKNADWSETERVKEALRGALKSEKPEVVRGLIVDLQKHKIDFPELPDLIAKIAATDPQFQEVLVDMMSTLNKRLEPGQIAALRAIATSENAQPATRAKAIRTLYRDPGDAASMDAAVDALAPLLAADKPSPEQSAIVDEFVRDTKFTKATAYFAKLAESSAASPAKRELADAVLLNLATSRLVKPADKAAATKAVDAAWAKPANAVGLLRAAGRVHADAYADKVQALTTDKDPQVAQAATIAAEKLGLRHGAGSPATGPLIEAMKYEDVVAAVQKDKGDAALGKELFQRQGCIACHTTSQKEPQKGPMLGGISGRYNRAELCESIIKPNAKIAQGFETQWFKTKAGDVVEGFVSREGGDEIEVRGPTGAATVLKTSDVARRGKRDFSIMPEGLVVKLTPHDLASLIAFLESTKAN